MTVFEKFHPLPDYYPTMYQDGYSPAQVYDAFHRTMRKRLDEMRKEQTPTEYNINIKSEVKIK